MTDRVPERKVRISDGRLQSRLSPAQISDLARRAGMPSGASMSEIRRGVKTEREHADVLGGDELKLMKTVAAHLKELPDYYKRLGKMESRTAKKKSVVKSAMDSGEADSGLEAAAKSLRARIARPGGTSEKKLKNLAKGVVKNKLLPGFPGKTADNQEVEMSYVQSALSQKEEGREDGETALVGALVSQALAAEKVADDEDQTKRLYWDLRSMSRRMVEKKEKRTDTDVTASSPRDIIVNLEEDGKRYLLLWKAKQTGPKTLAINFNKRVVI